MAARALMLQGTGSDVGKSLLVAGLARAYADRGLRVLPFKPQNMSNNAAVTIDGGEIGRAQALQARAAGIAPTTDMNPVLLKPQSDVGAQVVVQGRIFGTARAADYHRLKPTLLARTLESFHRLAADADLVLVEGAGSPAEVNLRAGDIANMGFAGAASVPVVLVGDIDRGGVIAAIVGTWDLLDDADRRWLKGFLINKFRGDPALFDDGLRIIRERTGLTGFGVLPWFDGARRLPAEDGVVLDRPATGRPAAGRPAVSARDRIRIAVARLPRIANFDDIDPLAAEPGVEVVWVRPGEPLPGDAHAVILPGSKATLADLEAFRREGWDGDLAAHVRRGGTVIGLCGGYQMLGRIVRDPQGREGSVREAPGLGLLDVETVMEDDKTVRNVAAHSLHHDVPLEGYEIHLGRTDGPDRARPVALIEGVPDGATSADGRVFGTYLHGLFGADLFRKRFLAQFGVEGGGDYRAVVEAALDAIAARLEEHLDCDAIFAAAR